MPKRKPKLLTPQEIAAMRQQIDNQIQTAPIKSEWDVYRIVATLELLSSKGPSWKEVVQSDRKIFFYDGKAYKLFAEMEGYLDDEETPDGWE